ncbi:MAG: Crp/Fnr family transcriptional regulator [Rhodospirillales bacterium RIFCSPLOWO2_12_FULL_58_28]|nr:MAG: Crp/Fnr family transcriptional regulator [Rhodospirillales bacterium RIFCSPLOWO2_02_FULL_58_16]OHC78271.1 MAG: Crp/Fnr family transcriptional regulator [Rhodospirillales bacterium RIFCSPLOWO2_12_FULL_58_28]
MNEDWVAAFPGLRDLEMEPLKTLRAAATPVTVPAGTVLFQEGSECGKYILVLDGSVRVQKISESGREIVLYRVENGQACVLTTSCLMCGETYGAEGVSETEVKAVALPKSAFRSLLATSEKFREFVFTIFGKRISDLMMIIEEVAFHRIDGRLAQFLLEHADAEKCLNKTHQELAAELGSVREVISRQLKEFERRGWVALSRKRIEILNAAALADLKKTGLM